MWPRQALEQGAECKWWGTLDSSVSLQIGSRTPACLHRLGLQGNVWMQVLGTLRHTGPLWVPGTLHNCGYEYFLGCVCVCVCACLRARVCPAPGV